MKQKVVIIIDDDSDEKSTTYSVNKDGVIEIQDVDEVDGRRGNPVSISHQSSSSNGNKPQQVNSFNRKNVKSLPLDSKIQSNASTLTNQNNTPPISNDKRRTESTLMEKNSTVHMNICQTDTANTGSCSYQRGSSGQHFGDQPYSLDLRDTANSRRNCVDGSLKRKCSSSDSSNQPGHQHKRPCTQQAIPSRSQNLQTPVCSRQVLSSVQNTPNNCGTNLASAEHVLFIDLDNWQRFLSLPHPLPPKLFVLGFCGGNYKDTKRLWSSHFRALVKEKRFYQHPKCGKSKNAADIALCIHASRLDLQLPKHIPFTVLSGDKDFRELKAQLNLFQRQVHLVDPHHKDQAKLYKALAMIGKA